MEEGPDPFKKLGNDVRRLIFSQCQTDQLGSWLVVCKSWKKFIKQEFQDDMDLCWRHKTEPVDLLEEERIRDCSIRYLNFAGFTSIRLDCTRLTNAGMALLGEKITKCLQLETLELWGGRVLITDVGFENVATMLPASLKRIAFRNFQSLTAKSLRLLGRSVPGNINSLVIARWQLLDGLDFTDCAEMTDNQLGAFLKKPPKDIKSLKVGGCISLTDASAKKLEKLVCKDVVELHLGSEIMGTAFSEKALTDLLLQARVDLTILNVHYCQTFTDDLFYDLQRVRKFPTKLLSLDVGGCHKLSYSALYRLLDMVPKLQHLSFGSDQLTDVDVEKLLKGPIARMRSLRTLSLNGSQLTNKAFELLEEHLPYGMESVDLIGCTKLDALVLRSSRDEQACALLSALPGSVRDIFIDAEAQLTDEGFLKLLPYIPRSVQRLHLHGRELTDQALLALDRQFKHLSLASPKFTEKGIVKAASCLSSWGTSFLVRDCALSDEAVEEVLETLCVETLKSLHLCNAGLTNAGLEHVARWLEGNNKLTELALSNNQGLFDLRPLTSCLPNTGLITLQLDGCNNINWIGYRINDEVNPFANLRSLSVSGTSITDDVVELLTLPDCKIDNLNCNDCTTLTGTVLGPLFCKVFHGTLSVSLKGCTGITQLDLSDFHQLTDKQLGYFFEHSELPTFTTVKVGGTNAVTKAGLLYLLEHLQDGLLELDLSETDCTDALNSVVKFPWSLRRLRLAKTAITSLALDGVFSKCSDPLEILDLQHCPGINDAVFTVIRGLKRPENLKRILLSGTACRALSFDWPVGTQDDVTDDLLRVLLHDKGDWLESVVLPSCTALTDVTLQHLSEHRAIRTLNFRGCTGFSEEGLGPFLQNLPSEVETLELGGCSATGRFSATLTGCQRACSI